MTLSINNTESDKYLCTKLNTKIKGNNLAMGNVWDHKLIKPTVVNNKEIDMQAQITNKSDNIIELPEGAMHIQQEMKPTYNKVLINTNFLVTSITTITQDTYHETKEPISALSLDKLTTPPNYNNTYFQNEQDPKEMVKPIFNSLQEELALPFNCAELQKIVGRKDIDLSQHMSMIYNPA